MLHYLNGLDSATTALIAVHCWLAGVSLAIFSQRSALFRALAVLISAATANLLVFIFVDTDAGRRSAAIAMLLILAGWLVSQSYQFARGFSFATRRLRHPLAISLMFCIAGVGCLYWSDLKTEQELDATDLRMSAGDKLMSEDLVEVADIVAETDHGRRVRLWKLHGDAQDRLASHQLVSIDNFKMGSRIEVDRTNPTGNCHGWVFLNGGYFIFGESVVMILEDNGYSRFDTPTANDLIVYQDKQRRITHSGIIRGLLPDGRILVESKWSTGGRFIHFADESIYGSDYLFYRSNRPSALPKVAVRSPSMPAQ